MDNSSGGTKVGSIYYDLDLNDTAYKAKVAGAKAEAGNLATSVGSASKSISGLGSTLMPLSIAAAGALGFAAKSAMDFQASMELVRTQAGATQKEVDNMTQAVLKLAPAVGESPKALSEALFYIESAGMRGAKALDTLKLAAEGAQVGNANLADTSKSLVAILNTNIAGAENATVAMGNLNAIVGAGMMHFEDLNAAIGTGFFGAAATFGVSLQSAGAALATMTRYGVPAVDAATKLRMAMVLMSTPTAQAQKTLEAAGFSMSDVKTNSAAMTDALSKAHVKTSQMAADLQKPDGFNVAIMDMKKHLADAGISGSDAASVISKAFGGGRSSGPILQMINNTQALQDSFNQINKTAGDFPSSWAARQEDASFKMDKFKAELTSAGIQLGQAFLPTLTAVAKQVGALADKFSQLSPGTKKFIVDSIAILAVLGPMLKLIGTLGSALGYLAGLWHTLVIGFNYLTVGVYELSAALGVAASEVVVATAGLALLALAAYLILTHWQTTKRWFDDFIDWMRGPWGQAITLMLVVLMPWIGFPLLLMEHWKPIKNFFVDLYQGIIRDSVQWYHDVIGLWQRLPSDIVTAIGDLKRNASQWAKDAIYAFFQGIADVIQAAINGAFDLARLLRQWFKTGVEGVKRDAPQWGRDIVNALITGLKDLGKWDLSQVINWYRALDKWWQQIDRWFKDTAKAIPKQLDGWWQAFDKWIKSLPEKIWQSFDKNVWQAMVRWIDSVPARLTKQLDLWWQAMDRWIKSIPNKIYNELDLWWQAIQRWIRSIPERIKEQLELWYHELVHFFKTLPTRIMDTLTQSGRDMGTHHADSFAAVWKDGKKIAQIAGIVLAAIVLIPIIIAVAVAAQMIIFGIKVIGWIVQGIGAALGALRSAAGWIFSTIINAVSGAGSWLYNTGKQVIQGMINGIEDAAKGIAHGIGKVGSDIGGAVKSALHSIHIPGFAEGVQNFAGGLAIVGERGPELVNLPSGSDVIPNNKLMGASPGNTVYNIDTVQLTTAAATREFFSIGNRNTQLEGVGIAPLAGTTRT